VDVRVIAATNRDLRAEIANRTFREDLYYRLNVVTVRVPALRERRDDIPLLANHFLERFGAAYSRTVHSLSPEVVKAFLTYDWPGNVRELQNVIQRAVLLADSDALRLSDLPEYFGAPCSDECLPFRAMRERRLETVEKPFLVDLLKRHRGNVSDAAADAMMTRKMIYRLSKKFGIDVEEFRRADA
jgi:DNA-binding NtrC family response regulator